MCFSQFLFCVVRYSQMVNHISDYRLCMCIVSRGTTRNQKPWIHEWEKKRKVYLLQSLTTTNPTNDGSFKSNRWAHVLHQSCKRRCSSLCFLFGVRHHRLSHELLQGFRDTNDNPLRSGSKRWRRCVDSEHIIVSSFLHSTRMFLSDPPATFHQVGWMPKLLCVHKRHRTAETVLLSTFFPAQPQPIMVDEWNDFFRKISLFSIYIYIKANYIIFDYKININIYRFEL